MAALGEEQGPPNQRTGGEGAPSAAVAVENRVLDDEQATNGAVFV